MLLQDKICIGNMMTMSCAGDVNISDVTVLSEQQGLQSCLHVHQRIHHFVSGVMIQDEQK